MRATSQIIRADGVDATNFSVLLTDSQGVMHDVTEESEIYYEGNDTPLTTPQFASTKEGVYTFYAMHGFNTTQNDVEIRVTNGIPELSADPAPASTDFNHRILLVQHTGTGYSQCPDMMVILKHIAEDDAYNFRNAVFSLQIKP